MPGCHRSAARPRAALLHWTAPMAVSQWHAAPAYMRSDANSTNDAWLRYGHGLHRAVQGPRSRGRSGRLEQYRRQLPPSTGCCRPRAYTPGPGQQVPPTPSRTAKTKCQPAAAAQGGARTADQLRAGGPHLHVLKACTSIWTTLHEVGTAVAGPSASMRTLPSIVESATTPRATTAGACGSPAPCWTSSRGKFWCGKI
jgi:hypothetical protein